MCKELTDLELGWAAGLLEGEGCFGWYGPYNGYPLIAVCSVDQDVILKFSKLFKGTFRETKPAKSGKKVWEWRATGLNAVLCMQKVLPHMSKRRADKIVNCLIKWHEREDAKADTKALREIQCPQGHPWVPGKFSIRKSGKNLGSKSCYICLDEQRARRKTTNVLEGGV